MPRRHLTLSASSAEVAIFFALPGNEKLTSDLADLTCGEVGRLEIRHFPDGETYVRVCSDVARRAVYVVCTLARPDTQFLPLSFAAAAIRNLGASSVQLVAPYLAYMRQDRIFRRGEALTSRLFAELLQQRFDSLITIDPHLHRHASLDAVYDIPTTVVHAAPLFAEWIASQVKDPLLIGPDAESMQWVECIARAVGAPSRTLRKERKGDRKVRLSAAPLAEISGRTPVLVDDIVSSGTTMKEALRLLATSGSAPPYCLAIHALCSRRTSQHLDDRSAGFLTTNTVPNANAAFDVGPLIADALISAAAVEARFPTPAPAREQRRSATSRT